MLVLSCAVLEDFYVFDMDTGKSTQGLFTKIREKKQRRQGTINTFHLMPFFQPSCMPPTKLHHFFFEEIRSGRR